MNQAAFTFESHDPVRAALARLRVQVEAEYGGRSLLFERFLAFHADNPRVLALLLRFADELIAAGRRRFGIAALWERMRWFVAVETRSATGLKLNNSYRSFYARLLLLLRPALVGVLETRRLGPGRDGQVI
jgi:hypothetical protein